MATHWKGTAQEKRALDAYIRLMRCVRALQGRLDRRLVALGLTETQFGVLETLFHLGAMSQSELAGRQFTSGANLTYVVDQLEKKGWVRRERSATDRRVVRVRLKPAGRVRVKQVLPGHVAAIVELFGALDAAEQVQLGALCRTLGLSVRASD